MKIVIICFLLFIQNNSLDIYLDLTVADDPRYYSLFCWSCVNQINQIKMILANGNIRYESANSQEFKNILSPQLNYNDKVEISFRSREPARFWGSIIIEGFYLEISTNNNFWKNQNNVAIKQESTYFTFQSGTENKLTFTIPNKNDFIASGSIWTEYKTRFNCYDYYKEILHDQPFDLPLGNTLQSDDIIKTTFTSVNNKPVHSQVYIIANDLKGTIIGSSNSWSPDNNNIFNASYVITYVPNPDIIMPYCDSFQYYSYDEDSPIPKTCEQKTITMNVCGKNCNSCKSCPNNLCDSCLATFHFRETDRTQCFHPSDGYYIDNNDVLQKCYHTCATCSTGGTSMQHNCNTCLNDSDYILKVTVGSITTKNCLPNCGSYYEKYGSPTKECLISCSSTHKKEYIHTNNTKYCFESCEITPFDLYQKDNDDICIDCKTGSYQYVSHNELKCYDECTKDKPYIIKDHLLGKCVDHCGSQFNNGDISCESTCITPFKYVLYNERKCVITCEKESTTSVKYYTSEEEFMCYKDCSYSFVNPIKNEEGYICTKECVGKNKYVYEDVEKKKECKDKCPDDKPYFKRIGIHRVCTDDCLPQFINPKTNECVNDCKNTEYQYIGCDLKTCTEECSNLCKYISSNKLYCVSECNPGEVIIDDKQCATHCDELSTFPYLEENTCVKKCSPSYYSYEQEHLCLSTCEFNDKYKYGYTNGGRKYCVDNCLETNLPLTETDNTCTNKCDNSKPSIPPYFYCVDSCTYEYGFLYKKNMTCLSECPLSQPYSFEGECFAKCPSQKPKIDIDDRTCVTKCAPYYEIDGKECEIQCTHKYPYEFISGTGLNQEKKCLMSCSNKYLIENKRICVSKCEGTLTPYIITINSQKTCTDSCKKYGQFLKGNLCVQTCGNNNPINPDNNECVDNCSQTPYPYHDTEDNYCVEKCNRNYRFYSEITKECYSSCNSKRLKLLADGSNRCISECDNTSQYHYNYNNEQCVDECNASTLPYINHLGTKCIESCQSDNSLLITGTNQCVKKCEGINNYYFSEEKRCFSSCENDFIVQEGNTLFCYSKCPNNKKYKLHTSNGIQCVASCAKNSESNFYTYVNTNDNTCIEHCEPGHFIHLSEQEQKCYSVCPPEASFEGEDRFCYKTCPKKMPFKHRGKCYSQCPNGFTFYDEDNNCLDSCEFAGLYQYGDTLKCVSVCKDEYFLKLEYTNSCINKCPSTHKLYNEKKLCTETCPDEYKYTLITNDNKICVKQCIGQVKEYINSVTNECIPNCASAGNEVPYEEVDTKICLKDCDDWTVIPTYTIVATKQCVTKCPSNYPYIMNKENRMECVNDCVEHPYTLVYKSDDGTQMECLQRCGDSLYGAEYQYYTKCVVQCPDLTKVNDNNECLFDLQFGETVDGFVTSGFSKNQINQVLDEIVILLNDKNEPIKGNDFLLEVYPTNKPFLSNQYVSDLDFSQCEYQLRQHYNLDTSQEIILAKFDYINSTSYTNQVEYKAYTSYGRFLDMECCKDIETNIKYPFNNINNTLDFAAIQEYAHKGIDLLDPASPVYNDICLPFGVNGTDVLIEDRRDYIYKNLSLCEEGCVYQEIDFENEKVVCNCSTKTNFNKNDVSIREAAYKNDFQQQPLEVNFLLMKCYHLLSDWNYFKNSASVWMFSSFLCVSLSAFGFGFLKEMVTLYTQINSFVKGNPPHKGNNTNSNGRNKVKENTTIENVSGNISSSRDKKLISLSEIDGRLHSDDNSEENSGRVGYLEKYLNQPEEFQKAVVKEALKRSRLKIANKKDNEISIDDSENNSNNNSNIEEENSQIESKTQSENSDSIEYNYNEKKPNSNQSPITDLKTSQHFYKTGDIYTYIHNKNKFPIIENNDNIQSKESDITISSEMYPEERQYPLLHNIRQDNYPLILAFKYDTRDLCTLFLHFLLKKIPLIRVFKRSSKFELISLNLSFYILYICLLFIINTVIYTSSIISSRFKSKGSFDVKRHVTNAIITNFITFVIMKYVIKVNGIRRLFETIFVEVKDETNLRLMTKRTLIKVRCKIIMFYVMEIIIIALGFYYVGLFNIVYKYSQVVWIYSTLISIGINDLFIILVSLSIAVLRKIGIQKYSKYLYNLSVIIDGLIW